MNQERVCAQCNTPGDLTTGPEAGFVQVKHHGFLELKTTRTFYHFRCLEAASIEPETLVVKTYRSVGWGGAMIEDPKDFARWTVWA